MTKVFSIVEGLRRITSLHETCELAGGLQRLHKNIFISGASITYKKLFTFFYEIFTKKLELFFGKMKSIFLEGTENFVHLPCQY